MFSEQYRVSFHEALSELGSLDPDGTLQSGVLGNGVLKRKFTFTNSPSPNLTRVSGGSGLDNPFIP